jgi:crotonobetainyl-CoA hydratase
MTHSPIVTIRRGAALEIVLDRPKANAIDTATSRAMASVINEVRDDPEIRVAILTGAGPKFFSAGWDLKAGAAGEHERMDWGEGGFCGLAERWDLDKPVIAAVNGLAAGGGVELALSCDLILAVEHAEFFMPETSVGNMADAGGVQRLPRRIPYHVAMDLLLTGRRMGAHEAAHFGLVNRVLAADELMPAARRLADEIVERAPLAVQAIKEVLRGIDGRSVREAFEAMNARRFPLYERMLASEDRQEGPRAFAEKRPPRFVGA